MTTANTTNQKIDKRTWTFRTTSVSNCVYCHKRLVHHHKTSVKTIAEKMDSSTIGKILTLMGAAVPLIKSVVSDLASKGK